MTCGCRIVTRPVTINQMMNESHPERQIDFCPLHKGAEQTANKLKDLVETAEKAIPIFAEVCTGLVKYSDLDDIIQALRQALKAVKGE